MTRRSPSIMVAKDRDSAYTPGRTLSWLKVMQGSYRREARGFHKGWHGPAQGRSGGLMPWVSGLSTSCGDCQPC
jgi:hypothetical protein